MATINIADLWRNNDAIARYNAANPTATAASAKTTAQSQTDVNDMSVRDRFWDSLNYTYGQQREASDRSFAQAYSQADRQMLGRGMQRSSYGAQTLANINQQKIDAQNNIYSQQIADYERQLYQMERDQIADEQWQKEFKEGKRQFNIIHGISSGSGSGGSSGGSGGSSGGSSRKTTKTTTTSSDTTADPGKVTLDDLWTETAPGKDTLKTADTTTGSGSNWLKTTGSAINAGLNSVNSKSTTTDTKKRTVRNVGGWSRAL